MGPRATWCAMMRISEIAQRLACRLDAGVSPNVECVGVSTDSRSIAEGELFVALTGENFDAHNFLAQVKARGAIAAVVSRRVDVEIPQLVVGDTMLALGVIAQYWRSRFTLPILALTGSNGKTTVKEMLRSILIAHLGDEQRLLATEGNLNNNIGVPQMLLRLRATHQLAVLEMGMNHLLEIDYLTRLAAPDVAIINMAGTAHIGELGSREAIAQAKGEIYAGLRGGGIACINIDDRFADYWRGLNSARKILTFGTANDAQVRGELNDGGVVLHIDGQSADVALAVAGVHNRRNAIAAAAGAHALGVPLATIAQGLRRFVGVAGRLQRFAAVNGSVVIDDSYNANPDSMRAAISVLAELSGPRVLVLGDMAELGADAASMHAEIGVAAREAGIERLFCVGTLATEYEKAFGSGATHFASIEDLVGALALQLGGVNAGSAALVKGSRSARMERVLAQLAERGLIDYQKDHH